MNNNQPSGEMMVLILVVAVAILILKIIFYAVLIGAIALTAAMTLASFAAWNRPRTIFGEVVTPEEARTFIWRGLMGGASAYGGAALYAIFAQVRISENLYALAIFGGYFVGSVVTGLIEEQERQKAEEAAKVQPPMLPPALPPVQYREPPPFRYADWDDEDARS